MRSPVSPEQLGQLLDDYGGTLALFAARWTNQAEDCVQEAFVELARQAVWPDNPAAWLFRVVKNRALSAVRQSQRRQRHEATAAMLLQAQSEAIPLASVSEIAEALDTLPDDQRTAVIARTWGGLGFEALGELLNVSTATAHRKYEAALSSLRERLGVACPPQTKT